MTMITMMITAIGTAQVGIGEFISITKTIITAMGIDISLTTGMTKTMAAITGMEEEEVRSGEVEGMAPATGVEAAAITSSFQILTG